MTKHDKDETYSRRLQAFKGSCFAAARSADTQTGDVPAEGLLSVAHQFLTLTGDQQNVATFWVAERMKDGILSMDLVKARAYQQMHDRITGKTRRKGAAGRPRRIER